MARENRKIRIGEVTSNLMDRTVVVSVRWQQRHRLYRKGIRRISKFYAHDASNACKLGDRVRIEETKPLSRIKRWRILDILEQHEVAEVKPVDLDEGLLTEEKEVQVEQISDEVAIQLETESESEDNK